MKIIRTPRRPHAFSPKVEDLTDEVASRIARENGIVQPDYVKYTLGRGLPIATPSSEYRPFYRRAVGRREAFKDVSGSHTETLPDGAVAGVRRTRSRHDRRQQNLAISEEDAMRSLAIDLYAELMKFYLDDDIVNDHLSKEQFERLGRVIDKAGKML